MSLVTLYKPDGSRALVEPEWVEEWVNDKGLLREPPVDEDNGGEDGTDNGDNGNGEQDDTGARDPSLNTIIEAIRQLDPEDPALWTKQGKPQVDALESALGIEVSAAERDAAWEIVQSETDGG